MVKIGMILFFGGLALDYFAHTNLGLVVAIGALLTIIGLIVGK